MAATARFTEETQRRLRARRESERRGILKDLNRFIPHTSPDFTAPTHMAALVDALDRSMTEPVYALVSTPPRHFKSETMFHGVARRLKAKPSTLIAYVTYSAEFAIRKSRRMRTLAARAGVWVGSTKTVKDRDDPSNTVKFWQTPEGGGLIAGGRGGGYVGEGFGMVILDDPIKNRMEAESETIRDNAWEVLRMLLTRLDPGASVFLMMQRWHEDDPIGRVLEMMDEPNAPPWEVINLPALNEKQEPLCPERYDSAALASIRVSQGEYNWWSQYMGNPKPPGDRVFAANWARFEEFLLREKIGDEVFQKYLAIAIDPAGTAKTKADNTSIVVGAGWKEVEIVIEEGKKVRRAMLHLDIIKNITMKKEVTDVTDVLYDLQTKEFPGVPIVLEIQGGEGKAVMAMLKRVDPRLKIVGVTTTVDKLTRNLPYAAAQSNGRVRLPRKELEEGEKPWIEDYADEHRKFTGRGDKEDDRVDSGGHLFNYLDGAISVSKTKAKAKRRSMVDSPY